MNGSSKYVTWIAALSVVSFLCILGIVWGELQNHHLVTAVLTGVVLLAYSFILLFLRKGGFTGV